MKAARIVYWQSGKNRQWYFSLRAPNGKTIAQSEGYRTERGCLHGIAAVQDYARLAEVVKES